MAKTGTSAIQKFMHLNRRVLKKNGILYPNTGIDRIAHHRFAWKYGVGDELTMSQKKAVSFNKLKKLCKKKDVVISSETLFRLLSKPEVAEKIRLELEGCDVHIIVYLRRQDYALESGFAQRVKSGYQTEPFDIRNYENALNYYEQLSRVSEVFGKEKIIVRSYEKAQFYKGSLYSDFLNCFGLDLTDEYTLPPRNTGASLDGKFTEFCRIANSLQDDIAARRRFNSFLLRLPDNNSAARKNRNLTDHQRRSILEMHAINNMRIAKEFQHKENGILFNMEAGENDVRAGLSVEDAVSIAVRVYQECTKK